MALAHLFPGVTCFEVVTDNAHSHDIATASKVVSRIKPKRSRWESNPEKTLDVCSSPTLRVFRVDRKQTEGPRSSERRVSRWDSQPPLSPKTVSSLASHKQLHPRQSETDVRMASQRSCPTRQSWDSCPTLPSRLDCGCRVDESQCPAASITSDERCRS
jgi:hypothetical protein